MRTIVEDPEFDYILLCNKICGAAHFNMQMKIVVDSQEDYDKWIAAGKQLGLESKELFSFVERKQK